MVLPVLALGAVALVGAVAGGVYAYNEWWDRKSITVLGGRGTGKTTLLNYFATKKITKSYEQTDTRQRYSGMTVKMGDLTLKIKEGYDVAGSSTNHAIWREQIDNSDVVFYIVDISQVIGQGKDQRYIDNTIQDIEAIANEVDNRRKKVDKESKHKVKMHIIILATHADKCPEFHKDKQAFEKKVARSQVIETAEIAFGGADYCKVIIGSLKDTNEAEKLVKNILSSVN